MTQARVTTTAIADADIGDIANYIASDNPRAAEQFEDEIFAAQERISEFPKAGRLIEDIPGNFLVVRVSQRFHRYLIFYRIGTRAPSKLSASCMAREMFSHCSPIWNDLLVIVIEICGK